MFIYFDEKTILLTNHPNKLVNCSVKNIVCHLNQFSVVKMNNLLQYPYKLMKIFLLANKLKEINLDKKELGSCLIVPYKS